MPKALRLAVNAANPATYFFGKTMTYADLDAQVRAAAATLPIRNSPTPACGRKRQPFK